MRIDWILYLALTVISPSSNVQWQRRQSASPLRTSSLWLSLQGMMCAAAMALCCRDCAH